MKSITVKPSDVAKDEEVELWERRIQLAEARLKEKAGEKTKEKPIGTRWQEEVDFYKGNQWKPGQGGKEKTFDRITANQAKSNIDSIRPQLYFNNPRINISLKNPSLAKQDIPEIDPITNQPVMVPGPPNPMTGISAPVPKIKIRKGTPIAIVGGQIVDAREQAELIEAVDNYTLTETRAAKKIRRIINDALIVPYGVAKWEWVVEMETAEEKDDQGNPTGKQIEKVARQYADFTRVKPWCFIWDCELDEFDIDKAKWYAEIKYLSKEEIQEDASLKNTEDLGDPDYYVGEENTDFHSEDKKEELARYKLYEIHDLQHGEYLVWIEGSEKLNRKDSPSAYDVVEGGIYTVLGFNDVPDDSFPESTIDQIKSKAQAYNKVLSYMVNHVSRFNRKYKHVKGAYVDEHEKEKWERGEDGTDVEVNDMSMGPEPIQDAAINADVYNVASILKKEITEDIGVSAYNRATREAGVDTAFEANLIQGGADIKIQEKRDTVRHFCIDLIRKLNQIICKHADTESVVKIAGEKGERWVKWTKNDIKGEFLVDVDIYSSMPFSEEVEKKQALEMFSIAGADPYFNPMKVRQQLLRVFKWPEDILFTEEELAAQQQQMQMQQQQAQEAQKQQSRNIRPTSGAPRGTVQNGPDMKAAIAGQARNMQ